MPESQNETFALLCHFGHADVLECRVLSTDPHERPWRQVLVGIYVTDARQVFLDFWSTACRFLESMMLLRELGHFRLREACIISLMALCQ